MIRTLDLQEHNCIEALGRTLRFAGGGVSAERGGERWYADGFAGDGSVEIWIGDAWCCFAGLDDPSVFAWRPQEHELRPVGKLARLDFEAGYDPGGMHRVEFAELPGGDLLIGFECGAARLERYGDLAWMVTRPGLALFLQAVEAEVARFRTQLDEDVVIGLADGSMRR
jgi:hypothetical protein